MAKDWTQDEVIKDLERVIEKQDAEIERLRGALKEILTHETDYEPYDCIEIARAALKGDE